MLKEFKFRNSKYETNHVAVVIRLNFQNATFVNSLGEICARNEVSMAVICEYALKSYYLGKSRSHLDNASILSMLQR